MNRLELLKAAADAVASRGVSYGKPETNFQTIAAYWSVLFGRKIAPHEVAMALILMKVARAGYSPEHVDHCTDIAGYAACMAEIVSAGGITAAPRAITDPRNGDGA